MRNFTVILKAGLSLSILIFCVQSMTAQYSTSKEQRDTSTVIYINHNQYDTIYRYKESKLDSENLDKITKKHFEISGIVNSDDHILFFQPPIIYPVFNEPLDEYHRQAPGDLTINVYSKNYMVPDYFSVNYASGILEWNPIENWRFIFSLSGVKIYDNSGIYDDVAISASSHIPLYNRFSMNLYGGYSYNSFNNSKINSVTYAPYVPSTYFGGSVEYSITKNIGVEIGILRNYNSANKKWETMYIAAPTVSQY